MRDERGSDVAVTISLQQTRSSNGMWQPIAIRHCRSRFGNTGKLVLYVFNKEAATRELRFPKIPEDAALACCEFGRGWNGELGPMFVFKQSISKEALNALASSSIVSSTVLTDQDTLWASISASSPVMTGAGSRTQNARVMAEIAATAFRHVRDHAANTHTMRTRLVVAYHPQACVSGGGGWEQLDGAVGRCTSIQIFLCFAVVTFSRNLTHSFSSFLHVNRL